MKTVVAFANGRGGKIVFGIDDKTLDIVGMDVDNIYKTMDAITNAISDACEPTLRPDVGTTRHVEGYRLRAHFVDRREFEGSIQEQMKAAYQYVLEKLIWE